MAVSMSHSSHAASLLTVDLGTAAGFAVLAGAGITVAAPANSTVITGDIGSHATPTITGLENLVLTGTNHGGDSVTQGAKTDLMIAYLSAAARNEDVNYVDGHVLTGTLFTGVYQSPGSLSLNGALTLDAQNDPDAVWIFQMGSSLNVASPGQINLINGALATRVFWQVGSSATLETGANLAGSILASQSITMKTGSTLNGRALASIGAVTLGSSTIAIPEPAAPLLATIGLGVIFVLRRR